MSSWRLWRNARVHGCTVSFSIASSSSLGRSGSRNIASAASMRTAGVIDFQRAIRYVPTAGPFTLRKTAHRGRLNGLGLSRLDQGLEQRLVCRRIVEREQSDRVGAQCRIPAGVLRRGGGPQQKRGGVGRKSCRRQAREAMRGERPRPGSRRVSAADPGQDRRASERRPARDAATDSSRGPARDRRARRRATRRNRLSRGRSTSGRQHLPNLGGLPPSRR